jgi:hypothetical protein
MLCALPLLALERPGVEYKVFQFPADRIPRVDGDGSDWEMVPESYVVGMDQLKETVKGRGFQYDKNDLDVRVKVGWVRGMNRLYFLYEASDNYWDFAQANRHNDIFEVVVDGDLSGGPLISAMHSRKDSYFDFHGVHAQNYHIFTPAPDRDWTMVWGCQPWIQTRRIRTVDAGVLDYALRLRTLRRARAGGGIETDRKKGDWAVVGGARLRRSTAGLHRLLEPIAQDNDVWGCR